MSAVARISTAPAAPAPLSRGIAKSLATAESALIPVLKAPWPDDLYRALATVCAPLEDGGFRYRAPEWQADQIDTLRQVIACGPDKETLDAYALPILEAKSAPPDRAQTTAMIGMMLDAFPNGRPANFAAYADSLVHDLLDLKFSPAAVAIACRSIRRTSKFMPSVAEMVEAAEAAKGRLSLAIGLANNIAIAMEKGQKLLTQAEAATSDSAPAAEMIA
jgi:hypothetical protein